MTTIAGLDPNAKDYAARKKEIERKYEIAASDTRAKRAGEDVRGQAAAFYREADKKEADANARENERQKIQAVLDKAYVRRSRARDAARIGGEEEQQKYKEADATVNELEEQEKRFRDNIAALLKEATSLRERGGELAGGNLAANTLNAANKQRIENEAAEEKASLKKQQDEEVKRIADEKAKREQKLEDARLVREKEEALAALDPSATDYEDQKREVERTYEVKAAELKVSRAVAKRSQNLPYDNFGWLILTFS